MAWQSGKPRKYLSFDDLEVVPGKEHGVLGLLTRQPATLPESVTHAPLSVMSEIIILKLNFLLKLETFLLEKN